MLSAINLCTSVLPGLSMADVVEIATAGGYQGIELRVNDDYHLSLADLERHGRELCRRLERKALSVAVLNSYIPVADEAQVDRLIECAALMGVPRVRVVLPRSARSAVAGYSSEGEIIPSYDARLDPKALFRTVQESLRRLEQKAISRGVKVLLELHWGTIMSGFCAARLLLNDIDPRAIGLTFDPANMVVEGREDWEFGIQLMREYIDNIHVKNAAWGMRRQEWCWQWSPIQDGMVDWHEMVALLNAISYRADYAIEDFLTPRMDKLRAIEHLAEARTYLRNIQANYEMVREKIVEAMLTTTALR
jgi:sugar phosphate isomerase/epimerase